MEFCGDDPICGGYCGAEPDDLEALLFADHLEEITSL